MSQLSQNPESLSKTPELLAETAQNLLVLTAQTIDGKPPHPEDGYDGDPLVEVTQLLDESDIPLALHLPQTKELHPLTPEGLIVLAGTSKYLALRLGADSSDHRILGLHSATGQPNFQVISFGEIL